MEKILSVYKTILSKSSNQASAAKLGMTIEDYLQIKSEVLLKLEGYRPIINDYIQKALINSYYGACDTKVKLDLEASLTQEIVNKVISTHTDLDTGKTKLEAISSTEPKTPEEIIQILNIDTSKWRLSQYWNKERAGHWLVSALVTQIDRQEADILNFYEALKEFEFPKIDFIQPEIGAPSPDKEKVCAILSLQDLHYGKMGNDDITNIALQIVDELLYKCDSLYFIDQLVIVLGGDLLNMDTFLNTTTKGTPVESSMTAQNAYLEAFTGLSVLLQLIGEYAQHVKVVFIPGNHDRLSSFHLVHALSESFKNVPLFTFMKDYSERKVLTYGENMFCFEHGDVFKKTTPLVYATEYPAEWGQTTYRTLYTGHCHIKKTIEYITDNEVHGFSTKIIPSLSSTDYWHYHNKFIGSKRAAILEVHGYESGKIAEFSKTYKL
jgi:predicted MPP superfamily phosphohydrolase